MNLGLWQAYIRAVIPAATISSVPSSMILQILNSGVVDITKKSKCLKSNQQFNVVQNQGQYNLTAVITNPNYLIIDKSGLWWNNGTEFTEVYPKTEKWLDNQYTNWRSQNPGNPQFYIIEGDILTTVLTPNTALVNGFWLYFIPMPTPMVNATDFPFVGPGAEIPRLRIFDEALEAYVRWKVNPILSKDNQDITQMIYKSTLDEAIDLYNQRPDIVSEGKMRVPNIC